MSGIRWLDAEKTAIRVDPEGWILPWSDSQSARAATWHREIVEERLDGGEPEPYVAPAPPPITDVSALQGKLALDDAGLYDAVEAICTDHPVQAVRLFWSSATRWERGHPVIAALALELDPPLSEEAVDALFEAALLK